MRRWAAPCHNARVPWLVRDDEVLASLEIAESPGRRARGLLGRDGIDGALLLRPARWIHTYRMRFDIDVAYLDAEMVVLKAGAMRCNAMGRPVMSARSVLEAEAGAFQRWGLRVGDRLTVRG